MSDTDFDNPTKGQSTKNVKRGLRFKRDKKTVYIPAYANIAFRGNVKKQAIFWLLTLLFFVIFMFVFSSILLPFVAGIVLAYFLNPIVELLERIGISRMWGTVLITIAIVLVLVIALTILIPVITSQLQQFIREGLPVYVNRIQAFFANHSFEWIKQYIGSDASEIQANIQTMLGQSSDLIKSVLNSVLDSGKSLVNLVSLFVVAPVVAFYMLLDWERMIKTIDSWIPRNHLETVRGIFHEMDRAVAGFIRGQTSVCLALGVYYAAGLTILSGKLGTDHRCYGCIFCRTIPRRLCFATKIGRTICRAPSGLANVRTFRLWFTLRIYRHAHCSSRSCSSRGSCTLCSPHLS